MRYPFRKKRATYDKGTNIQAPGVQSYNLFRSINEHFIQESLDGNFSLDLVYIQLGENGENAKILLNMPAVLKKAVEEANRAFSQQESDQTRFFVDNYIANKIKEYDALDPDHLNDLSDNEISRLIQCARRLIVINQQPLHEKLTKILSIPAINQKLAEQDNSLLRLALSVGNLLAADLLKQHQEVKDLAELHNYYPNEDIANMVYRVHSALDKYEAKRQKGLSWFFCRPDRQRLEQIKRIEEAIKEPQASTESIKHYVESVIQEISSKEKGGNGEKYLLPSTLKILLNEAVKPIEQNAPNIRYRRLIIHD